MNKKYIDKEEWIGRLEEELSTCKNEKRKEYLRIWINAIKCQPTIDEKEIIRKPFKRVVENLAECTEQTYYKSVEGDLDASQRNLAYHQAIAIIKEECGISEQRQKISNL